MVEYAPCPKCNAQDAERMGFTWWGGILGPKILSHVKCGSCGTQYNGKTGKDNTTAIIIYSVVVFLVVMVFVIIAIAALIILLSIN